ncbi:MAG: 4Fe-4S binding protein [Candidatus Omnitrophica bacterium]|nr:4Fe-4S binding protein [Candidatus Omnitrophota bacterium]
MKIRDWFLLLSAKQKVILFLTVILSLLIILFGFFSNQQSTKNTNVRFTTEMSIEKIAPKLGVTRKSLARELDLPLDVSKRKSLKFFGVTENKLSGVTNHLLSHVDAFAKYYLFFAIVLFGFVYLNFLGRPDKATIKQKDIWYPQLFYILFLFISLIFAGFLLGKSPNPMEGVVKVFKSMIGLYPDPIAKTIAFIFFIILAIVGNKLICGWACPFGALQELIYSIPILKKIKKHKLPFVITNSIRGGLFILMPLFLFGIIGGREGFVIYHYLNPFNLFDFDFESLSILLTVVIVLVAAFFVYRPFCQLICPFGFISWIFEKITISKVQIDKEKCVKCGICVKECPLEAAKGRVNQSKFPADCFSCGRCLNVCPYDAIKYKPLKK